jgi:hypothetical protein
MNTQLIDDLAAQAWRYANNYAGPDVMPVIKIFHRKLAELIVAECAQRAAQLRHVYPHQAELTATTILTHFGVKP